MLGEEEFPVHFHEGKHTSMHISVIAQEMILVVIFDDRSSLGLVRLRVKRAYSDMNKIYESVQARMGDDTKKIDIFSEITDDDIDSLFGDAF